MDERGDPVDLPKELSRESGLIRLICACSASCVVIAVSVVRDVEADHLFVLVESEMVPELVATVVSEFLLAVEKVSANMLFDSGI